MCFLNMCFKYMLFKLANKRQSFKHELFKLTVDRKSFNKKTLFFWLVILSIHLVLHSCLRTLLLSIVNSRIQFTFSKPIKSCFLKLFIWFYLACSTKISWKQLFTTDLQSGRDDVFLHRIMLLSIKL